MKRTIASLLRATGGSLITGRPSDVFDRVSIDTRSLKRGNLFFALKGPHFDGHNFLRAAADGGAAAIVIDQLDERADFDPVRVPAVVQVKNAEAALQDLARSTRRSSEARVIGVTGSNGKTTTKEMLASILRRKGKTLATRGNLNNQLGLPLTLCELEPDHRYAVIEMGTSKPGDMELLSDIARPEIGLITNVGKDHLEFFHTPDGVLATNRVLLDRLPKDGIAIINLDDPLLAPLVLQLPCRTVTYGKHGSARVRVSGIEPRTQSVSFKLFLGEKDCTATLNGPGAFQVYNALAAAAVAYALEIPSEDIVEGLRSYQPAAMRMQVHELPSGAILINDAYNANPSSVKAVVESYGLNYGDRPRWVVLGDMRELGPGAREEHEALGQWLAQQPIERVLLYGRDTRFVQIGMAAVGAASRVERFRKKRYLIEDLQRSLAASKPVVLFKASRRMKLEQVITPLLANTAAMETH